MNFSEMTFEPYGNAFVRVSRYLCLCKPQKGKAWVAARPPDGKMRPPVSVKTAARSPEGGGKTARLSYT